MPEETEVPEEPENEDEDEEEVVVVPGDGPAKTWGSTRGRFNKGSQMRVENKAFIKN